MCVTHTCMSLNATHMSNVASDRSVCKDKRDELVLTLQFQKYSLLQKQTK